MLNEYNRHFYMDGYEYNNARNHYVKRDLCTGKLYSITFEEYMDAQENKNKGVYNYDY